MNILRYLPFMISREKQRLMLNGSNLAVGNFIEKHGSGIEHE